MLRAMIIASRQASLVGGLTTSFLHVSGNNTNLDAMAHQMKVH